MITIGLICEGVSEINIMTRIISKYFNEETDVNPIEPETILENGRRIQKDGSYGGWQQVLRHCNDETITNILDFNDYLVIQIDSDTSGQVGYDVNPLNDDGKHKEDSMLYNDIKERLHKNISKEVLEKYAGRILYAICINEIECWLLPLYYTDNNRCRTNNCIYSLNQALQKKNIGCIPEKDKNGPNARIIYDKILKNLRNKKTIQECAYFHYSFNELTKQLDALEEVLKF